MIEGVLSSEETATGLAVRIRRGDCSAREVVSTQLAALHRVHEATNGVVAFDDGRALADAEALDAAFARGGVVGPLHGVPITVKDWIDVEGFPCAGVLPDGPERRPGEDATAVARLRAAGAVVMAKTRAWGEGTEAGRVTHPVRPERSVGGSSSGEAALVAAGGSPLGLGSDSGGSIRLPAAWCGVFGLKPSAGRVPTTGHFPRIGALSDGRTQIGPIARSVDDLETALAVMCGLDWRDGGVAPVPLAPSAEADVATMRFAVVAGEPAWEPAPAVADAVDRAAAALVAAGATRASWTAPWLADALDITRRYWTRHERSGAEVASDLWDWDRFRRRYLEAAEHIDLVVSPAALDVAPRQREITGDDFVCTLPASLTGSPAIVVPAGVDGDGMPVAVQLVGRPWEDHRVLAAARALAAAFTSF